MASFKQKFQSYPTFTIRDVKLYLTSMGASKNYSYTFLHHLINSGRVVKVNRGIYSFHQDISIVGFAFHPFYYGLQDALSWRNLWEQETGPVVITPRKVRSGVRSFLGRNYVIRRIDRAMFFGLDSIRCGEMWLPISDPEKTLIDFIYFKEFLPGDAREELLKIIRLDILQEYLGKIPSHVKSRVLRIVGDADL
ncbi:MAG: type IV toxin-antitoxin system AbiEi family antitoxin domain-containing protein [Promethearchaeota archaeon]